MHTFTAVIEKDSESGWFIGYIPTLPGAHSQAETIEELRENLIIAAHLVIADMLEHGEKLPLSEFLQVEPISLSLQS